MHNHPLFDYEHSIRFTWKCRHILVVCWSYISWSSDSLAGNKRNKRPHRRIDKATICPINQSVLCVYFQDCTPLPATMAKSTFLDILSKWPLFGSTFFLIKSVADSRVEGECHLAINKDGVHFLRAKTHVSSLPP